MLRSALRTLRASFHSPVQYVPLHEARGLIERTPLLPEQHVPTPETANMSFENFSAALARPTHVAPTVYTSLLSKAQYSADTHCVLDASGAVILESTGPGGRPLSFSPWQLNRPVKRIEGIVTSFRCCFNDFYHLLIDNLSRFDLLNFEHFRSFPSISLLCPGGLSELESFFVHTLCPSNVTIREVDPGYLYEPDQFLFNTFITSRASGYLRGPYVDRLRSRLGLEASIPSTERIFISRSKASKGRRIHNEEELMGKLRTLGFRSHILEALPLSEQISLFQRAEAVIAPHGAGLSHLLFANHTRVLELFPGPYVLPHYYHLAKSLGHHYSYLTGPETHRDDDFHADVEAVYGAAVPLLNPVPTTGTPHP